MDQTLQFGGHWMSLQIAGDALHDPSIGVDHIDVRAVVDRVFVVAELADLVEDAEILCGRRDLRRAAGEADEPRMKRLDIFR